MAHTLLRLFVLLSSCSLLSNRRWPHLSSRYVQPPCHIHIYVLLELRINPLYIYSSLIFSLIFLHLFVLSRIFSSLRSFQPNSQEMPRSLVSTPSISPPRSSTIVPEKEIAPYSVRNMTLSLSIGNVAARFILELFKWS